MDEAKIVPDSVWCNLGSGKSRVRITDLRRDGRVVIERIAGSPGHTLRRELTITPEQLRAAFQPTAEVDYGQVS